MDSKQKKQDTRGGSGRGQGRKPSNEPKYYRVKMAPWAVTYLEQTFGSMEAAMMERIPEVVKSENAVL